MQPQHGLLTTGSSRLVLFWPPLVLDVFSRYVVGWMVAPRESAELAKRLIADTCEKQNIQPGQLTLPADRGSSMRSKPVAFLLADLAVIKSHSRPYVSDDNPYSESHFRALEYRPDFPDRFGCIEDSLAFCQKLFAWYDEEHRHSGIELLTPSMVSLRPGGSRDRTPASRARAAYQAHPARFVRSAPKSLGVPQTPPGTRFSYSGQSRFSWFIAIRSTLPVFSCRE
jgi:putative transposase